MKNDKQAERATPAAASAGAAGTIDTVEIQLLAMDWASKYHSPFNANRNEAPAAWDLMVKQFRATVAEAVKAHEVHLMQSYAPLMDAVSAQCRIEKAEAKLRAATAPVSAAPSDGEIYAEVSRRADPEGYARSDAEARAILAAPAAAVRAAERIDAMHKGVVGVFAARMAEHLAGAPVSDSTATAMKLAIEWADQPADVREWAARAAEHLQSMAISAAPVSAAEPAKAKIAGLTDDEFAGRVIDHVFDNADNDRRSLVIGVASLLAMRQPDPAGEWVKRADLADLRETQAEKDVAEAIALWDAAMAHAAFYVNDHCADGEFHAEAIMSMKRPEFRAAKQAGKE